MQQSTEKKDRYYIKCIMDFIRDMQAEQMSCKKQQQLKSLHSSQWDYLHINE